MNSRNPLHEASDTLLIRQAVTGDLDAFNQLVLSHQDMAFHHAYALLGDPASADDAAQEGFVKAFEHIASFRGGSFRAWLLKIVTNAAYDIWRRSKRYSTQSRFPEDPDGAEMDSVSWLADPHPSVDEVVEQKELSGEIYRTLDELPEVYRSVITLIDLYEFDYVEAAQALRIPVGTIKSRLARGRLRMQQRLKDHVSFRRGNTNMKHAALAG